MFTRILLLLMVFGAIIGALLLASPVRADTDIDQFDQYIRSVGLMPSDPNVLHAVAYGVCDDITSNGTAGVDTEVTAGLKAATHSGFTPDDVGTIIVASVKFLCPQNMAVLQTWAIHNHTPQQFT